jgi:transposase
MKDGRTHLAHKAEHAVDLKTGAVIAVTIQPADKADTETIKETLITAAENLEKIKPQTDGVREVVADKGYHSNELLKDLKVLGIRTYISEPARGHRHW